MVSSAVLYHGTPAAGGLVVLLVPPPWHLPQDASTSIAAPPSWTRKAPPAKWQILHESEDVIGPGVLVVVG
jgi:hypothetical protein